MSNGLVTNGYDIPNVWKPSEKSVLRIALPRVVRQKASCLGVGPISVRKPQSLRPLIAHPNGENWT